jgi:hypothetical protein
MIFGLSRGILLGLVLLLLSGPAWGESLKHRIERLEREVEEIRSMVQATVSTDLDIYRDPNDPTQSGDIKVITGSTQVSNCDANTGWSVYRAMFFYGGNRAPVTSITGNNSNATANVAAVLLSSGSWVGGNATGFFFLSSVSGNFQSEEMVKEGANTVANCFAIPANPTLSASNAVVFSGNGSIKITMPATSAVALVFTANATDLSAQKYIKSQFYGNTSYADYIYNIFGETNVWENASNKYSYNNAGVWKEISHNISAIAANNRNAVTKFGLVFYNGSAEAQNYYLDDLISDGGLSAIKAFDGDRVIALYPKIFMGNFLSSGNNQTVYISANGTTPATRKGTPATVMTIRGGSATYNGYVLRHKDMAANNSVRSDGGAMLSDGILSMGDGNFTIGTNVRVNPGSNETIYFVALYED